MQSRIENKKYELHNICNINLYSKIYILKYKIKSHMRLCDIIKNENFSFFSTLVGVHVQTMGV